MSFNHNIHQRGTLSTPKTVYQPLTINQNAKRISYNNSIDYDLNDNDDKGKESNDEDNDYKTSLEFSNECPGGNSCVNLLQIEILIAKIKKLKEKMKDLINLNSYFVFTLNQKNNMYKTLFEENNSIKRSKYNKPRGNSSMIPNISNQCNIGIGMGINGQPLSSSLPVTDKASNTIKPNLSSSTINILNKSEMKNRIPVSSTQIISFFKHDQHKNNQIQTILQSKHYDDVIKLSHKTSRHQFQSNTMSFLSMTIDQIKAVEYTENMEFIKSLIQSEEYFVSKLKNENKEFLIDFNESLRTLCKDYLQIIKLIIRIRQFIQCGVDLNYSIFTSNTNQVLIENTCKLLDCERAVLYIHNPISDMLNEYSSANTNNANTKKGQMKISKTRGIVGMVYNKGEKIKIDDTKIDLRFKKEDESKDKRYKKRNLICYPLKNMSGLTFGVLEASNKRGRFFNPDDEEFMVLLIKIASVVLSNKINNDYNMRQVERLEKIIKYSNDIRGILDRDKLMEFTEGVLASLFTSGRAMFVFVIEGQLIHYAHKFPKGDNLGIINLVLRKKEYHGCSKARRCKYYNTLVDIEASDSLMTYPIMYNDECIAIAQVSLSEKISELTHKPNENEIKLLGLVKSCIIEWHLDNKNSPSITQIEL